MPTPKPSNSGLRTLASTQTGKCHLIKVASSSWTITARKDITSIRMLSSSTRWPPRFNNLWLIKEGKMWKVTVTTPKGNHVSYCNMRYGPAPTKNVAACGYYNVEADGHEKATEYS